MCNESYYKAQTTLVNLIQENDDYDIIDIIETVSKQHNIDREDAEEMYENLYPNKQGSSMNTQHYHHVRTMEAVKDRILRIMKRGNKSTKHMFHDVQGFDLVTFHFCNEEGWILVGYDINDNIHMYGKISKV